MANLSKATQGAADLSLWYKVRDGDDLTLADIPEIIPLRWVYFRDTWEFIKPQVQARIATSADPDFLNSQIQDFSKFIERQRHVKTQVNPFNDTSIINRYYAVFDNVMINSINLTNEEENLINQRTATISNYSKNDFLRIKTDIAEYRDTVADICGLSDATYNSATNRSSAPTQRVASMADINLMTSLQENLDSVNLILANLFAVDTALDPFALARANANNPDIDIGLYASGTLVKMEYGENLESLAKRYFGDPNKWIDIAIANGLKPPYVDEVGERLYLISNGNGDQINISPTDVNGGLNIDRLYINQVVVLQSDTQRFPDQRVIVNIRQIPISGEIVIQLSGEANLDQYKLTDNAHMRVYAPNTTNSALYVLIPSTQPLTNQRKDEVPWFLANKAEDEKMQKVDLAIDDQGNLNFDTNGDLSLSYGLDNAIQAIKIKMMTELGTLRYHPNFGIVSAMVTGSKNNNLGAIRDLLIDSINQQIQADSRFNRVEHLSVDYVADSNSNTAVSVVSISMSVRLAGGNTVIPISFTVSR